MKLIHTSDWHFGMPVGVGSYRESQQFFLEQLYALIRRENVQAVLCAGDIYDSGVAGAEAIRLFNGAATALCAELGVSFILIAGNHDSAARLASCRELLRASGMYVTGKLERDMEPVLLSAILDESGYEKMLRTEGSQERLDNLAELKQSVYEYETSCGEESVLEHYLANVALFTNSDAGDSRDKVKLMTVHAAKGLEFPYVFLCAMNEGVFPSRKTRTREAMEEERRLAFVAMTRAQRALFLSEAEGRNFDGSFRYPSRFLLDISPELLSYAQKPGDGLIADAREYIAWSARHLEGSSARPLFSEGKRVRHGVFGLGTVIGVDAEKSAYLIQFDNIDTPRAISFRAKIESV